MGLLTKAEATSLLGSSGEDSFSGADLTGIAKGVEIGLRISEAHFKILSLKQVIKELTHTQEDFNKVFAESYALLLQLFSFPNLCVSSYNGEIKVVIFSRHDIPESMLQTQLSQSLEPVLGKTVADTIFLLPAGRGYSLQEIKEFLSED